AERSRLEIELLLTLGTAQFSTKGYGSEDVERTFSRARALGEELGEEVSPKVLTGIMGVHFTRSDRESTAALLPIFRELAGRGDHGTRHARSCRVLRGQVGRGGGASRDRARALREPGVPEARARVGL